MNAQVVREWVSQKRNIGMSIADS